jgi:hypothetical protein
MKIILAIAAIAVLTSTSHAKWALVTKSEVRQVWADKPKFHPDVMKSIVSVSNAVDVGWRLVGNDYLPPKTDAEKEVDAFDAKRVHLKSMSSMKARKNMADTLLYKLTEDDLNTGYPDKTQPLCATDEGEALSLNDFMDYIQMRDDDGATQPELQVLKQKAKAARRYFKTLKP